MVFSGRCNLAGQSLEKPGDIKEGCCATVPVMSCSGPVSNLTFRWKLT
jgi:hypothetical protein